MLMAPEIFLDESRGRIYHYCGDWEYLGGSPDMEGSRAAFVLALRELLRPILSQVDPELMRKHLTGETDSERARRLQREEVVLERTARAAAESKCAAAKSKATRSGGYDTAACPAAPPGKKKGKKH
jgi:hypothetical protein